jgi:hypothetical protein
MTFDKVPDWVTGLAKTALPVGCEATLAAWPRKTGSSKT